MRILGTARKKVEGMRYNVSYSQEKEKRRSALLYWKTKVRMLKGNVVDQEVMEKWKTMAEINTQIEIIKGTIEELEKQYKNGKKYLKKDTNIDKRSY